MELTNNLRKTVASLDDAKHRRATGLFKAEGLKTVEETIHAFRLRYLFVIKQEIEAVKKRFPQAADMIIGCARADMERMTALTTPREVIAVYEIPEDDTPLLTDGLILALDDIRDPGNLGTIIRTAGWMGIRQIICSRETADVYNPKVVQSTMGAIARVRVSYQDLPETLVQLEKPIYGTFLDGEDLYTTPLPESAVIVIGNEGHGISRRVEAAVTHRITIPPFNTETKGESLNASVAAAITMAEFRRRKYMSLGV